MDLLIIDVMMPKLSGIGQLSRSERKTYPIIILSAKSEDADKILGLNVGADDYVDKPFNPLELVARVRSSFEDTLASGPPAKKKMYTKQAVYLDDNRKEVRVDGELVKLTPIEYRFSVSGKK